MDETKIQLSQFEMDLLNDPSWILTKNMVVKKAQRLLEAVQQNISDYTRLQTKIFPEEVIAISPKISKGENYLGLPWLMLDYPRYFDKENVFAFRTMFWWGNFFSTTLHLSGKYKQKYDSIIISAYDALTKNEFYSCINEEQWHHHLEKENYLPVKNFSAQDFADHVGKRTFIKLSQKLSFSDWNNAIQLLSENFTQIAKWLG
ncbi:MAG TPA: hypothetical protein VGQ09_19915 [Chitinophagaceae bacterium]|jgi:hypothetical protein|nr:hypothetical protein [Chitinophagaceae bacterium]